MNNGCYDSGNNSRDDGPVKSIHPCCLGAKTEEPSSDHVGIVGHSQNSLPNQLLIQSTDTCPDSLPV